MTLHVRRCPFPECDWQHVATDDPSPAAAEIISSAIELHFDEAHEGWTREIVEQLASLFLIEQRKQAARSAVEICLNTFMSILETPFDAGDWLIITKDSTNYQGEST